MNNTTKQEMTPKQVEALRRLVTSNEMLSIAVSYRHAPLIGDGYNVGMEYKRLQDFLVEQVQQIINNP
jgi:hypothetical protein